MKRKSKKFICWWNENTNAFCDWPHS